MASAKNLNEAIARLKAKYPHRLDDIDFVVAHLPESPAMPWQELYASVEAVIKREERRDIEKAAAQAAGKKGK